MRLPAQTLVSPVAPTVGCGWHSPPRRQTRSRHLTWETFDEASAQGVARRAGAHQAPPLPIDGSKGTTGGPQSFGRVSRQS